MVIVTINQTKTKYYGFRIGSTLDLEHILAICICIPTYLNTCASPSAAAQVEKCILSAFQFDVLIDNSTVFKSLNSMVGV